MSRKIILAIGLLILLAGVIFAWQYFAVPEKEMPVVDPDLDTTKLAVILEEYKPYFNPLLVTFSPDARNVAYIVQKDDKAFVVFNDQTGEFYDWVKLLTFSPDGKQFAYVAGKDDREFVVLNGQKSKVYDHIESIAFSPDSKQLAYVAKREGDWFAVLNGQESKAYDRVSSPIIFSPDSKQFAYVAHRGIESFVVLNDQEGIPYYNLVTSLTFSPDSRQFAYYIGGELKVLNGQEGKSYHNVESHAFSPDSKQFAYTVTREREDGLADWFVVLNGQKSKAYNWIQTDSLTFSPDSKQLAYVVVDHIVGEGWGKSFVVLNDQKSKAYDHIESGSLIFSPDSKHFAYIARKYMPKKGAKKFIILNDEEGKIFSDIWYPVFSPDSKYIVYGARHGDEFWRIVENVDQFSEDRDAWKLKVDDNIAAELEEEEFYAYVRAYREAIETNNPALLDPFPERVIHPVTDSPINPRQSAEDFFAKTKGRAIGKWPGLILYPRPNQEIESPIRLEYFAATSHYNNFGVLILDENQNLLGGHAVQYYSHWNLLMHHYVGEVTYSRPTSRKGVIEGVASDASGKEWTTFEIPIVFKDYLE